MLSQQSSCEESTPHDSHAPRGLDHDLSGAPSLGVLSGSTALQMTRGYTFKAVEAIGRSLPDVEVTTTWGQQTLKVRGKMFVCIASHKSAEPNSLVVMMDFADRDALVEEDPDTYYLKDHYLNYPCVLVRLGRVNADALRDLVTGAHRFISNKTRRKSAGARRAAPQQSSDGRGSPSR